MKNNFLSRCGLFALTAALTAILPSCVGLKGYNAADIGLSSTYIEVPAAGGTYTVTAVAKFGLFSAEERESNINSSYGHAVNYVGVKDRYVSPFTCGSTWYTINRPDDVTLEVTLTENSSSEKRALLVNVTSATSSACVSFVQSGTAK
jgi:hypothetical protein